MGFVVLAPYKVRKENQKEFFEVLKAKRKYFLENGFMTSRVPMLLKSKHDDEILIDVFEWTSEEHIDLAHKDTGVRELWAKMDELWEKGGFKLSELKESELSFPNFIPVDL
ncbi:MAG: hypothetical protein JSS63_00320 [Bacteroidetes bacterium]|nr:hypothetical protein [Bacteroidota bacterium]